MDQLIAARSRIDALDAELAALFARRMETVKEIAALKQSLGLPARDPARERALLEAIESGTEDETLRPYVRCLFERILELSVAFQTDLAEPRREPERPPAAP